MKNAAKFQESNNFYSNLEKKLQLPIAFQKS